MLFKGNQKLKKITSFISKVMFRSCIVIVVLIALFFALYFAESFIAKSKGEKYLPRLSLFTIISPSMVPNINVYDIVVDVRPGDIKTGDVITFISTSSLTPGFTITHRVTRIIETETGHEYYTKGDNNMFEDGVTVKGENIIGKVLFKVPQFGRVQLFLASPIGWITCILIPVILIVLFDILKVTKVVKIKKKSQEIAYVSEKPKLSNDEIKDRILANKQAVNQAMSTSYDGPSEIPIEKPSDIDTSIPDLEVIDDFKPIIVNIEELLKQYDQPSKP